MTSLPQVNQDIDTLPAPPSRVRHGRIRFAAPIAILLIAGALALGQAVARTTPGNSSAEAGFVRDMSVHHSQAVDMAEIVRDRTTDPTIRAIATEVVLVQQFQIGQIYGWLEEWKLPPTSNRPYMAWMGQPVEKPSDMPGMTTREEVQRLAELPSTEIDAAFLRMMIPHHQGGVAMAEAALERTDRAEVRRLASAIINTQQAEIEWMRTLLQRMGQQPAASGVTPGQGASGSQAGMDSPAQASGMDSEGGHGEEGFASSFWADMRQTARLAPLTLAGFAAVWLFLEALRRPEERGIRLLGGTAGLWQLLAVGGLLTSAVLHAGLTPDHWEENIGYGLFFAGATVALAVVAAAALVRPARPVFLAGAVVAAVLVVLYILFRAVPPPGAEGAESFDLTGLATKAAEVIALVGCLLVWRRGESELRAAALSGPVQRTSRPGSTGRRRRRRAGDGPASTEA